MRNILSGRLEIIVTAAMLTALIGLSLSFGLPMSLPSGEAAILFAAQALLPLFAIGLWACWEARAGRKAAVFRPILEVACYTIVMIAHFNLKLWVPFVRPVSYDIVYWRIDRFAYPLVLLCRAIAAPLSRVIGEDSGFYIGALPVMFYISLATHACTAPDVARKLFLSALILQGLGAIAYYIAPALGPFLFEDGANPALTDAQHSMFVVHQMAVAAGPGWMVENGRMALFAGLGAMPSLHAACSYLFVWFAWRQARILLPTYVPLFLYILVTAIASRWHYLVDIPAGIALARLSIFLAYAFDAAPARDAALAPARRQPGAALPGVPSQGSALAGDLPRAGAQPDFSRRPLLLDPHAVASRGEGQRLLDAGVKEDA